ncbi:hypothetical protein WN944_010577 [Citrus x changshan-huyou]|uniref:Uncharacterized protein n=1 Tax=Citrus x changshan-huyou TaxID=2935761 RepID=A0AAP0QT05_9ROSI
MEEQQQGEQEPTTPTSPTSSSSSSYKWFIRIMSKRRTWVCLFVVVYAILLSSSWNFLKSILSWYNLQSHQNPSSGWPALYASVLLGAVFGLLSMVAALAVAVPATLVIWITVLVLLAFFGKPRTSLVIEGRKITKEIIGFVFKILLKEGNAVAAVCAVLGYFALVNLYLLLGNPTVSVLPSSDDGEDGAWVVLTEKAGIWAIPEKAIVLGGVEPPERSLSRKGSSNERSVLEERRNFTLAGPRRVSSDAWDARDRQKAITTGIARRSAQDEESKALLGHLFHDFLLSGQVDGSFEKLQNSGAFERDGETSVFVRTSKTIVDTLAKHWTTTRGAEILSMVSSQLKDKQQEHEKFLQFLALSKRH